MKYTTIKQQARPHFHGPLGPAWSPRRQRSSGNEYENNKAGTGLFSIWRGREGTTLVTVQFSIKIVIGDGFPY